MHPGPMNRGMEIAPEVADSPRSTIVEQVANGVTVRMAVLYLLLGGNEPVSAYLITGVAAVRRRAGRRAAPRRRDRRGRRQTAGQDARSSTQTGWSRCPAWSTCTPTCASRAGRTPRPSRPAPGRAALGGYTAVYAMANTDPVADTAGVVEQVWRLGREAGPGRRAAGRRGHRRPGRRAAGRARRDGRLRRAGCGCSPTTGTASPTRG